MCISSRSICGQFPWSQSVNLALLQSLSALGGSTSPQNIIIRPHHAELFPTTAHYQRGFRLVMEGHEVGDLWPDHLWISESPRLCMLKPMGTLVCRGCNSRCGSQTVAHLWSCVAVVVPQQMIWSIYTAPPGGHSCQPLWLTLVFRPKLISSGFSDN